ncbi:MAG: phospholipase D-like domain-containing protein [Cyanobacteria bacterium]|nr:phospholipase D-like domain-containing protein [Cyanobacteriota bacterium]
MGRWGWAIALGVAALGGWLVARPLAVRWSSGGALPLAAGPALTAEADEVLSPLPQDPQVQVWFNQARSGRYGDRYRRIERPGDDLEAVILAAIAQAKTSIEVAVQELRLPAIAAALIERQRAGVRVRVILENDYARPWSSYGDGELAALPERDRGRIEDYRRLGDADGDGQVSAAEVRSRDTLVMLTEAGIPWIDDRADGSKGSGLMHHKFVLVDGRLTLVTSANFTTSDIHGDLGRPDSRGNPNSLVQIESGAIAASFRQEFDLMWGDGPGGQPDSRFGLQKPPRPTQTFPVGQGTIAVKFSPTSPKRPWESGTNGAIAATLAQAQRSVDLALFVFSEQRLADVLGDRAAAGVQVRALIDPSFVHRDYSEGLDLLGTARPNRNCQLEPGNRPWASPAAAVGVPTLPVGDLLHHKFGLMDDRTVIVGSHNWSAAADQQNDETLLIIENPTVAAHYRREFDRLLVNAQLGISPQLQTLLDRDRDRCARNGSPSN